MQGTNQVQNTEDDRLDALIHRLAYGLRGVRFSSDIFLYSQPMVDLAVKGARKFYPPQNPNESIDENDDFIEDCMAFSDWFWEFVYNYFHSQIDELDSTYSDLASIATNEPKLTKFVKYHLWLIILDYSSDRIYDYRNIASNLRKLNHMLQIEEQYEVNYDIDDWEGMQKLIINDMANMLGEVILDYFELRDIIMIEYPIYSFFERELTPELISQLFFAETISLDAFRNILLHSIKFIQEASMILKKFITQPQPNWNEYQSIPIILSDIIFPGVGFIQDELKTFCLALVDTRVKWGFVDYVQAIGTFVAIVGLALIPFGEYLIPVVFAILEALQVATVIIAGVTKILEIREKEPLDKAQELFIISSAFDVEDEEGYIIDIGITVILTAIFHAGRILQTGAKITQFSGIKRLRNALPRKLQKLMPKLRKLRVRKAGPLKQEIEEAVPPKSRAVGERGTAARNIESKGLTKIVESEVLSPNDMVNQVLDSHPILHQSDKGKSFIKELRRLGKNLDDAVKKGVSIKTLRERLQVFRSGILRGNWFQYGELTRKFKNYVDFAFEWTYKLGKGEFRILDGKLGDRLVSAATGTPKQIAKKYQEMMGSVVKEGQYRNLIRKNTMNYGEFSSVHQENKYLGMIDDLKGIGEVPSNLSIKEIDEIVLNNNLLVFPKPNQAEYNALRKELFEEFAVLNLNNVEKVRNAANIDPWTKRFFINLLKRNPNITINEMLDDLIQTKFLMVD